MSRKQPKVLQLLVKTHKLTVFLNAEGATTISDLKQQTLEALNAPVLAHHEDFENEVKNRTQPHHEGDSSVTGKRTGMDQDDDLQLDKGDVDLSMDLGGELGAGMHAGGEMGIGMGTSLHTNPRDLVDSTPRPSIRELSDFELCRGVRDRTTVNDARYTHQMTGIAPLPESFSVLDASKTASELKLNNWETLYVQYREAGSGKLMPVHAAPFPIPDDDDDAPQRPQTPDLEGPAAKRTRRGSP